MENYYAGIIFTTLHSQSSILFLFDLSTYTMHVIVWNILDSNYPKQIKEEILHLKKIQYLLIFTNIGHCISSFNLFSNLYSLFIYYLSIFELLSIYPIPIYDITIIHISNVLYILSITCHLSCLARSWYSETCWSLN